MLFTYTKVSVSAERILILIRYCYWLNDSACNMSDLRDAILCDNNPY